MSFFAPPPSVSTSVFTRLPERFRSRGLRLGEGEPRRTRDRFFLEGPCFDRAGRLYVTDIPFGRIFRISAEGDWEHVAEYDGWPNGLKIHRDGRIFITCYKRGIMLLDPDSGTVTPFLETAGSEGQGRERPDVRVQRRPVFHRSGADRTAGSHRPRLPPQPSGELTCLISTVPSPNGIVIDDAMTSLFVAVTRDSTDLAHTASRRAALLQRLDFSRRSARRPVGGPDGIALDAEGCLIVAHTGFGVRLAAVPCCRASSARRRPCAGFDHEHRLVGGADRKTFYHQVAQGQHFAG